MTLLRKTPLASVILLLVMASAGLSAERWSIRKANAWYARQPWRAGCDFIPSTAINQLEMWQKDTFDPETIDRELGWAEKLGFTTVRVFLHDLVYDADPTGFKSRIDKYLEIADKHHIVTTFVFFDDCWKPEPKIGKQPDPIPSVHNSGWMQSPNNHIKTEPKEWPRLETYVKDILNTHKNDKRIAMWDLYNEPGNSGMLNKSLPLLKEIFGWARTVELTMPISVGWWNGSPEFKQLNAFAFANSDVINFHNYRPADDLERQIVELKQLGRPLICTEYMCRPDSQFTTNMPVLKKHKVWAYNWGLVDGKTQTKWKWGTARGAPEPNPWFHEIFHTDGTPYKPEEVAAIKKLTMFP